MSKFARVGACILKVAFFYLTMNEIWKDVKGYEGKYQVSNLGRIRCLKNKRNKEGIMSLGEKRGYYIILVPNGKSRKNLFVHRLVAMAFTECCRGKRKSIGGYIWKYESIWKSNL